MLETTTWWQARTQRNFTQKIHKDLRFKLSVADFIEEQRLYRTNTNLAILNVHSDYVMEFRSVQN